MKIIILSNEIKIGSNYYPFNTIYFKNNNNIIEIYNLEGDILIQSHYSSFLDSNNIPFTTANSVIDSLRSSFI